MEDDPEKSQNVLTWINNNLEALNPIADTAIPIITFLSPIVIFVFLRIWRIFRKPPKNDLPSSNSEATATNKPDSPGRLITSISDQDRVQYDPKYQEINRAARWQMRRRGIATPETLFWLAIFGLALVLLMWLLEVISGG